VKKIDEEKKKEEKKKKNREKHTQQMESKCSAFPPAPDL
jgi:hypothetical protein